MGTLRCLFAAFILLSSFFCQGQTSVRQKISLDDNWKFKFGHAANPEKDFNYSIATIFSKSGGAFGTAIEPRFKDSAWRTLDLPHDWAVELPFVNVDNRDVESHGYKPVGGLFPETSIGWYRKHFNISSADSGTRFQIQFDGIFRNANIWLNGFFVGNNMCGFPKNIYYYYQSWWTDNDVLHISPHWNWRDKRNQPIDVWVNTNADDVELFLNGKSLGKKDMPRNSHLKWTVNYQPGTLEAVAYKKGKKLTTKIETTGTPTEVVMTPYKTTMLADGKDVCVINLSVVDQQGREVPDADNMIKFAIEGPGKIIGVGNGDPSSHEPDKCVDGMWQRSSFNGKCQVLVQSTKEPGTIHFEAQAAGLWTGSTDIVTVSPGSVSTIGIDKTYELKGEAAKPRKVTKMIGADISFLPQLEDRGMKFSDKGVQEDAIAIMKDHGFNYIRLRIFNDPARDSGYSPKKGFCDLEHTKQMAKRVKASGMKFLLDFHYSDYWADPGKQYKPMAWRNLSFVDLKKALYDYTKKVIQELKDQGTTPDMVQVGNEINHGMVWPEGNVSNVDSMSQLIAAGIAAVKAVDPAIIIMVHVALGGQNDETVFFYDQMMKRNIHFDVIGLSYYPKWHGTLDDLRDNMNDLLRRYDKDIIVVEYSAKKQEVNKLAFELPRGKGKGTCIWEPLSTWEKIFDTDGKANDLMKVYDEISKKYLSGN